MLILGQRGVGIDGLVGTEVGGVDLCFFAVFGTQHSGAFVGLEVQTFVGWGDLGGSLSVTIEVH